VWSPNPAYRCLQGIKNWSAAISLNEKMKDQKFHQTLENYRCAVTQILPAYISGRFTNLEALTGEIALVLDNRDTLAEALAESFRLMQTDLDQIDRLDQQLLEMKDDLLGLTSAYTVFRQQVRPPRNHWWYYLDKIVSAPLTPSPELSPTNYWLPLAPLPA